MRLIDADELLKKAYKSDWEWHDRLHTEKQKVVDVEDIDEAPTIEAEPVRHGHWIHCPEEDENAWRCSECTGGWLLPDGETPEANNMRFCHRCGARMDGGKNE